MTALNLEVLVTLLVLFAVACLVETHYVSRVNVLPNIILLAGVAALSWTSLQPAF